MKTTFGRACLALALVSLPLAAAVWVGLDGARNGATVSVYTAATMPLYVAGVLPQSGPDVGAANADADQKSAADAPGDREALKHAPALVMAEGPSAHEGKAFVAPGESSQPPSKDRAWR